MENEEQLSDIIREKIKMKGPVSFRDFMNDALYYPDLGYYTGSRNRIGRTGDYYTTPYATSILGEMLAEQISEIWNLMGRNSLQIVEFGGGDGSLARQILDEIQQDKLFYRRTTYTIVEKSLTDQFNPGAHADKINRVADISEMGSFEGCIISNELIDNFPFHRVIMQDQLMEVFVDFHVEQGFTELLRPAGDDVKTYFEELQVELAQGYQTEACLDAVRWLQSIARHLVRGFVLTIDYGFTSPELYSEKRSLGNVLCYRNQRVSDNVYDFVGDQDITTHVNFSALDYFGDKFGLRRSGYTNQSGFLRSLGLVNRLRKQDDQNHDRRQARIDFLFRFMTSISNKFKVLIQQKNVSPCRLKGLQFSMPF